MSRLYSEKELLKAIDYACGMQKAEDYQQAGRILIVDRKTIVEPEHLTEQLLSYLCDTDNNEAKSITIKDIEEHLKENK